MNDSREQLYRVSCVGMFVFGMILSLPGTVLGLPAFSDALGLSLTDRGTLIATLFGGLFAGSLLSGRIVDALSPQRAVSLSSVALALLLPAFAISTSFDMAVATLFLLGAAAASINTGSNALASDLFPLERGRRMNGIALAVGVGGLATPVLAAVAGVLVSWRGALFFAAAVSAFTAWSGLRLPAVPHDVTGERGGLRRLLRRRDVLVFCALVACGTSIEASVAGWTSTYLRTAGMGATAATWGLSSHWVGLILARLFFAARVDASQRRAIVTGTLAGAALMALLLALPVRPVLVLGPFAIGLAIAVVVPTSLALAGGTVAGNAGSLYGVLLTAAQVGTMTLSPLIGVLADEWSLRAAMGLIVVDGLAVALLVTVATGPGRTAPPER